MKGYETTLEHGEALPRSLASAQETLSDAPMPPGDGYPPEFVHYVFALSQRGEEELAIELLDSYEEHGMQYYAHLRKDDSEISEFFSYVDELNLGTEEQQVYGEFLCDSYDLHGIRVWRGIIAYRMELERAATINEAQLQLFAA